MVVEVDRGPKCGTGSEAVLGSKAIFCNFSIPF